MMKSTKRQSIDLSTLKPEDLTRPDWSGEAMAFLALSMAKDGRLNWRYAYGYGDAGLTSEEKTLETLFWSTHARVRLEPLKVLIATHLTLFLRVHQGHTVVQADDLLFGDLSDDASAAFDEIFDLLIDFEEQPANLHPQPFPTIPAPLHTTYLELPPKTASLFAGAVTSEMHEVPVESELRVISTAREIVQAHERINPFDPYANDLGRVMSRDLNRFYGLNRVLLNEYPLPLPRRAARLLFEAIKDEILVPASPMTLLRLVKNLNPSVFQSHGINADALRHQLTLLSSAQVLAVLDALERARIKYDGSGTPALDAALDAVGLTRN